MEADRDCTYADAFERSRVKFTNSGRERESRERERERERERDGSESQYEIGNLGKNLLDYFFMQ